MNKGKISQVIGSVLDLEFTEGNLPAIYNAVDVNLADGKSSLLKYSSIWVKILFALLQWTQLTD